ncbi:iron-sulfur cluster assembly accessory protein [Acuticoccus sp. I52.16.1]|uniref:HesB/IscA family protein n=1 Tax=Acuticoccus sp. I52.16.1 TaxID=2928472 RepID=UPI001FD4E212|nr:iron-sulfur cluster assembly accessory protein [Acuticoccus sp. I52.16.1]UOM34551.1 iron-sulfur cluster assembly accessory protein [Acuticoccus sp. I52.16.1]
MSRPAIMTMSDNAADRVREIVGRADPPIAGLRVGIKKGGCAGMEYTMDAVTDPDPKDEIVEASGARVFVDKAAVLFLLGCRMDYEVTKFRSGFTFQNPNQVSACGCGESVELKAAAE